LAESLNAENEVKGIKVPVDSLVEIGETVSGLSELLDNGPYEMLIMATKAMDTLPRRLFGTISADVSRKSDKPGLVVPPKVRIKFPGKMIVGFTEELLLNGALEYILNFGAKNNVFFDFVHIAEQEDEFISLKSRLYEKLVTNRQLLCGFNIRMLDQEHQTVHELLFDYAHEVRAGLVLFVSHHRSFIENLTHSSVAKKALLHPQIPVMVVHHGSYSSRA
jgi:nucleotide-binding universal stress UspA family protein